MNPQIDAFNRAQDHEYRKVCERLSTIIVGELREAEGKIWHAHPVWFLAGNPIVGYSKLKSGVRLMFWSGASFSEPALTPGTGKFQDASITYNTVEEIEEIEEADLRRWLEKSRSIQWDYGNLRKAGRLVRIA